MDVYDQFIDPTVVSHSISCHFTSLEVQDLIVVKNTILQVFQIHPSNGKLVLNHEFKLNGRIIGINAVRLQNSQYDQLAILTSLAKLSIVSFDHDLNTLQTNSLHYYENEFYNKSISKINDSYLKTDPNNQTSLVVYNDLLAFLPFKQDEDEILDDEQQEQKNLKLDQEVFHNSIILPVNKLESTISNIIDCDFLHSYRDPTLAILYNKEQTWASDLSIRKDTVNFVVLSLDLLNDSSTAILQVENLPYDLWFVKPLPDPINGTLLLGCNEIIHIDNSGNTKGIGLNLYYKNCTDFQLKDQSELNLFLENSKIEYLDDKNLLIIDQLGVAYNLQFIIDGKTIKDLSITKIDNDLTIRSPISITKFDNNLFIGCQSSDSVLINYEKLKQEQIKPVKVTTNDDDDLYDDEDDNNNDDDEVINFKLQIKDKLFNAGPLSSFTLGKINPNPLIQGITNPNQNDVSIVGTSGEGKQGKLTLFNQSIQPKIHSSLKFNNINKTWNILNKYLITTDLQNFKSEIFLINENFKNFQSFDFKNNNITINIDTIQQERRIVQITSSNVYLFDLNFKKLLQINFDFEIINGKIFDPFIILTSSKGEVKIFEMDPKGKKLNRIKLPKLISELIITFGTISLTKLNLNNSRGSKRSLDKDSKLEISNVVFLVTTVNNQILAFEKNHNEVVYQIDEINKLNEVCKLVQFNGDTKGLIPDPFIKEIEFSEIGDEDHSEEILTILTIGGELILYKIFKDSDNVSNFQKIENLNLITGAPENLWVNSTIIEKKLIKMNLNNRKFIFVTGKQPYLILKSVHSNPKIFKFTSKSAISICKIKDSNNDTFMYIDVDKIARICSLPTGDNFNYSQNLPIEIVPLGQTPNKITYHETSGLFIVSTFEEVEYNAVDEDDVPIVGSIPDYPKAKNFKGFLKLINPTNWTIIDQIELEKDEVINDVRSINLTISSRSKKKKEFIIFGIGKYRLEDLSVFGEFKIIDIISIVPDPTKPEAIFKFKEIFQEIVKGAVTALSEISGRFLTSQGQKIIIRDLQQDNSTVPVAFLDCATYISDAKSFGNLLIISDSMKSLWFLGFDAEPYRLLLLGKDQQKFNAITTDFIVDDGEVYFLVADDEESLHLLTYQPDDPKSLSGQKLLQKSTFKTNSLTTGLKLLPKFNEFDELHDTSFQNIGINVDGSVFKMTPIDEITYRRLYILQQQLSDKIAHYVGLNPRSNRFSDNEQGQKPIIDFGLLKWFINLNVDKRKQFSAKVGRNDYLELFKDFISIENTLKNLQ